MKVNVNGNTDKDKIITSMKELIKMNTLKKFVVGMLEENCYLLYDEDTKEASLIDPGDEAAAIIAFIKNKGLKLQNIILTHGHWDHIGAVSEIKKYSHSRILIHADDARSLTSPEYNLGYLYGSSIEATPAETFLRDGDTITIGSASYTVIHTPGHTVGGICLYGEERLFSGDTLFREGIGRSDLPGGNGIQLINGIKKELFSLPPETMVYPGHGPETTIGWEKENNLET